MIKKLINFAIIIVTLSFCNSYTYASLSERVAQVIEDAESFVSDANAVVGTGNSTLAESLIDESLENITLSNEVYAEADSPREYERAKHLARIASCLAMMALDEPEIILLDTAGIGQAEYERELAITTDKKENAQEVVYGAEFGGNADAEEAFVRGESTEEIASLQAEKGEYFKAYLLVIRSGHLYCLSTAIARHS